LLFLGVANLGDRTCGTTLLLFVICYLLFLGVVFLGEQTCVTTLLLFVICYLLFLWGHKSADTFRESDLGVPMMNTGVRDAQGFLGAAFSFS
jgi:hypothetical protein